MNVRECYWMLMNVHERSWMYSKKKVVKNRRSSLRKKILEPNFSNFFKQLFPGVFLKLLTWLSALNVYNKFFKLRNTFLNLIQVCKIFRNRKKFKIISFKRILLRCESPSKNIRFTHWAKKGLKKYKAYKIFN